MKTTMWDDIDRQIEALRQSVLNNAIKLRRQVREGFFKFKPFSLRQKKVLTWWCPDSPVKDSDGIIADGAIRSGKTLCMSLSFVMWAMSFFDGQNFAICGKTIGSLRRNVLFWLRLMLRSRGYKVQDRRSDNLMIVRRGIKINYFYQFGGKDERSQDLIQGITLAGAFFDEVALMPESFVNQATARCSVTGSKFWFNCNPEGPQHWFYVNWIKKSRQKRLLYLHFTMEDNLSLAEEIKTRYRNQYTGVFYDRFIRGLWVAAEGAVYRLFADNPSRYIIDQPPRTQFSTIGVDFGGTKSAQAFQCTGFLPGFRGIVTLDEYYTKKEIDPQQLESAFVEFVRNQINAGYNPIGIYVDSAEQTLKRGLENALIRAHVGIPVSNARKGAINDRIRLYIRLMGFDRYKIMQHCKHTVEAFQTALWNTKKLDDERLDDGTTNIDTLDAQEYSTEPYMNDLLDCMDREPLPAARSILL